MKNSNTQSNLLHGSCPTKKHVISDTNGEKKCVNKQNNASRSNKPACVTMNVVPKGKYQCPGENCPKIYTTRGALAYHFKTKHPGETFGGCSKNDDSISENIPKKRSRPQKKSVKNTSALNQHQNSDSEHTVVSTTVFTREMANQDCDFQDGYEKEFDSLLFVNGQANLNLENNPVNHEIFEDYYREDLQYIDSSLTDGQIKRDSILIGLDDPDMEYGEEEQSFSKFLCLGSEKNTDRVVFDNELDDVDLFLTGNEDIQIRKHSFNSLIGGF